MFKQNAFSLCAGTLAVFVLGSVFSAAAFAADSGQTGAKFSPAAVQKALAARQPLLAATRQAKTATGAGTAIPKEAFANPYLAYPPSCLNDGVPYGEFSNDPNAQSIQVTLYDYDSTTGGYDPENVNVTVWRVPCSGGVSATLLEIDRSTSANGDTSEFPVFPNISITQNSTTYYPRLPQDPNTVFSDTEPTSPLIYSSAYVFEFYNPVASLSASGADYNQAFTLNINTLATDSNNNYIIDTVNVPAYSPASFNNYPSAANPMEISGYMSTNWSNPNQSGEGMVLQVYDNGDNATRTLSFEWFTYDDQGLPFWLYGQQSFPIGATTVTAPTIYLQGGTFAPSSPSPAVGNKTWGNVTFTFPDCGDMNITYSGNASAVNGPVASGGSATYQRVSDVNGLVCQ